MTAVCASYTLVSLTGCAPGATSWRGRVTSVSQNPGSMLIVYTRPASTSTPAVLYTLAGMMPVQGRLDTTYFPSLFVTHS